MKNNDIELNNNSKYRTNKYNNKSKVISKLTPEERKNIKRGEIYVVDLDAMYIKEWTKHIEKKKRPCIVLSNNDNNFNSEVIHIAPITSEFKKPKFPTHVVIDTVCGLDEESIILIEGATTVSKDIVIKRIGTAENNATLMARIDRAINIQFDLVGKFNINYIIERIDYIKQSQTNNTHIDSIDYITKKKELKVYHIKFECEYLEYLRVSKDRIEEMYNRKQYEKCIKFCKKHFKVVNYYNDKYYQWYYNYVISICYKNLDNFIECNKYINNSLNFVRKDDDIKRIHSLWISAINCKNLNKIVDSERNYLECLNFYKKYEMIECVAKTYYNLGLLKNEINLLLKALDIINTLDFINENEIDLIYKNLFLMSLKLNNKEKLEEYINKIKNKELVKELLQYCN